MWMGARRLGELANGLGARRVVKSTNSGYLTSNTIVDRPEGFLPRMAKVKS